MPSHSSRSRGRSGRGFASMDPKRHKQISRLGGLHSHSGSRNRRSSK